MHNVLSRLKRPAESWNYLDPPLSDEGRQQAAQLRRTIDVQAPGVELVVSSGLSRALETAIAVFGCDAATAVDGGCSGTEDVAAAATKGDGCRGTCGGGPPRQVLVTHLAAEITWHGVTAPCDSGSPVTALKGKFGGGAASGGVSLVFAADMPPDEWWLVNASKDVVTARVAAFGAWLSSCHERAVAVVTHANILKALLNIDGSVTIPNCAVIARDWPRRRAEAAAMTAASSDADMTEL